MLKSFGLISFSAAVLFTTTQAHSHVLCVPNNPQVHIGHAHDQPYTVPRIQPVVRHVVPRANHVNHDRQKHLQAQRARQQRALANQRRINQQRRIQAQKNQQQAAARKAQQIRQQQAAAQRARVARQQAAVRATQYRAPAHKTVYHQPIQQVSHYHAPAPVYVAQPIRQYVPTRSSISFQINTNRRVHRLARRHIRHARQSRQVLRFPKPVHHK